MATSQQHGSRRHSSTNSLQTVKALTCKDAARITLPELNQKQSRNQKQLSAARLMDSTRSGGW